AYTASALAGAASTSSGMTGERSDRYRRVMEAARLARRTVWRNVTWFTIANVAGGAVVVVYLNYLTPGASGLSQGNGRTSVYVAIAYTAVVGPLMLVLSLRRFQPANRWLREDRPPTPDERRIALSGPAISAGLAALLWVDV